MVNEVMPDGYMVLGSTMFVPVEVKMFEPQAGRVVDDALQDWIAAPVGAELAAWVIIHMHPACVPLLVTVRLLKELVEA